jgi:hypothetical protein
MKLQNSISIKIPTTELVVPDTNIETDGAVQTNTSVRNIVINSLQSDNDNDLPVPGRLFMSSAYLMVNQEAGKFSIWQANTGSKTSAIVAVDKKNNMVREFCANSTGGSSSATSLPTSSVTTLPQNEGPKLTGGAIGEIAVGSMGGITMLCAIALFLYRRRGLGGAVIGVAQQPELQMVDVKPPTYSIVQEGPQELPVGQYDVTELDGRAVKVVDISTGRSGESQKVQSEYKSVYLVRINRTLKIGCYIFNTFSCPLYHVYCCWTVTCLPKQETVFAKQMLAFAF